MRRCPNRTPLCHSHWCLAPRLLTRPPILPLQSHPKVPPGRSPRPTMPPFPVQRNASVTQSAMLKPYPTTTEPSAETPFARLPGLDWLCNQPNPTTPPAAVQRYASQPCAKTPVPTTTDPSAETLQTSLPSNASTPKATIPPSAVQRNPSQHHCCNARTHHNQPIRRDITRIALEQLHREGHRGRPSRPPSSNEKPRGHWQKRRNLR